MVQQVLVDNELVDFPDDMTEAEIASAIKSASKPPIETPNTKTSGFLMGLKDPISGGAQLLTKMLPEDAVQAGNRFNNYLADYGLVSRLPEGGVNAVVQAEEQAYEAQRKAEGETGIDWQRLGGNIFNPATYLGGGSSLVARALTSGAISSALQPVIEKPDESFAEQKAKQVGFGAVSGLGGAALVKGASVALNPLASKAEQTMRDLGVQLTPGQILGGQSKQIEDFASRLPLVGSFISDAKERALFSFNKGVINKTLKKVGEELPEDVVGRGAVQYVNGVIDSKYDEVLSKINFKLDFPTYTKIRKTALIPPTPELRQQVNEILYTKIYSKLPKGRPVTGKEYKGIESDLLKEASSYVNSATKGERDVGEALYEALTALKSGLRSQNPKQSSELRRIDNVYGDVTVMKSAAANTNAENGVFTPRQYNTAVRQRDRTRNKTAFAAGTARGQDVSESAVSVMELPPGYNREGSLAYGIAGAAGLYNSGAAGFAVPPVVSAIYSETGIKVMETLLRQRPDIARKIGLALEKKGVKPGSVTASKVLEEYNRQTKTEEQQ